MIVVGSRLRGNETRNNTDARCRGRWCRSTRTRRRAARNYPVDLFVHADARLALEGLATRLPARLDVDPSFGQRGGSRARERGTGALRRAARALSASSPTPCRAGAQRPSPFRARRHDLELAPSATVTLQIAAPHLGVHALGGGIGQGMAMAIGAALAASSPKTIALLGDGGAMVNLAELADSGQEKAEIVFVLMNDHGYGVIRNIQDAQYGGRRSYARPSHAGFRNAGGEHRPAACQGDGRQYVWAGV